MPQPPFEPDAARTALVAEWILAGMRPSQIPGHAEKQGWGLSGAELAATIAAAAAQIAEDSRVDVRAENAKAVAIQDYKGALSVQRELNGVICRISNPMNADPDDNQADPEAR
jgi:hypothetical protein